MHCIWISFKSSVLSVYVKKLDVSNNKKSEWSTFQWENTCCVRDYLHFIYWNFHPVKSTASYFAVLAAVLFFPKKKLKILSIALLLWLDFLKLSYSNPCNKTFTVDLDLPVTLAFRMHIEKTRGYICFSLLFIPGNEASLRDVILESPYSGLDWMVKVLQLASAVTARLQRRICS